MFISNKALVLALVALPSALACVDSSTYTFGHYEFNGATTIRDCAWITVNFNKIETRQDEWCGVEVGGSLVSDECPVACDACPVTGAPPTASPRTISAAPTAAPTRPPSPSPSPLSPSSCKRAYSSSDVPSNVPSNNTSSSSLLPKPRLILHVGIMKTGTTSIQLELLRKKRWNRVYKKLLLDKYEVITTEYAPRKFENVITNCFEKGEEGCDYELWQELIDLYDKARNWNNETEHIVQVLETFSLIPKPFNDYTKHLFHSLNDKYDVRIVVFYRRLYEWIPSLYTQYRKPFMYRPRVSDYPWRDDYPKVDEVKLMPEWLEHIVQSNAFHYTTSTKDEFEKIFGPDKITVLDYHSHEKHGLALEFVCNGIPDATHACEETKLIAQEDKDKLNKDKTLVRRNTGDQFLLDHDLLIIEANREKLLTSDRHNATLLLEDKLQEMNMTISELPRICLSSERREWLQNLAEVAETSFSSEPLSKEDMRNKFSRYQDKLCSIDAPTVLKNSSWRKIFTSCEFQKEGC